MTDPYAHLADRFVAHYDTLRGAVRYVLVGRQLDAHLPPPPAHIADVGGGAGQRAVDLARRGYEVSLVDPSVEMLGRARVALDAEDADIASRVRVLHGRGEDAPGLVGAEVDAVLCHGVVMYLDDPTALISALATLARPGGLVSILAKNADALAVRPALQGRWRDSLAAFDADRDEGGLGVVTRADTVAGLTQQLHAVGVDVVAWYGVRAFTDHLTGVRPGDDLNDIVAVEWEAGRRDPYRRLARLFHVVGVKAGAPRTGSA